MFRSDNNLFGWNVVSGDVKVGTFIDSSYCSDYCAVEGIALLDMCGTSAGTIEQEFKTVIGEEYVITFQYSYHTGFTSEW